MVFINLEKRIKDAAKVIHLQQNMFLSKKVKK